MPPLGVSSLYDLGVLTTELAAAPFSSEMSSARVAHVASRSDSLLASMRQGLTKQKLVAEVRMRVWLETTAQSRVF